MFEISSDHTWPVDLGIDNKLPPAKQNPARYAAMGVAEYFVFDLHRPGFWTREWRQENRLVGWRLNSDGTYSQIVKDEAGRLWSEQLQSWLQVDGQLVRLYDSEGRLRLKEVEALNQQNEFERQQVVAEQRRADIAQRRAEAERQRADEEARKLAALIEKLRAKGIDPDTL